MKSRITRRTLGAAIAPAFAAAQANVDRPNVLFILSDDQSEEFLGASGNPYIRTPNLDRFASEGARFTRFFTAAPQCVPSRTAFLTGRSPVAARMGRFTSPLPADVRTFAEDLRAAGYFTGVCGRNHHLDGSPGGKVSGPIYQKHDLRTMRRRFDFVDVSNPDFYNARVNEFLDKKPAGKPFFLWLNYVDPHYPWDANALTPGHDPAKLPLPKYLPDLPGVRSTLVRYYDEIGRVDGQFQATLDIVEKRGFKDNTLIFFIGDNGAPIPHGKGSLYDPGCNVPCLIRWPGRIKPGTVSNALLSGEDIGPTVLEACGLPVSKDMSGVSFLPILRGRAATVRQYVYAARVVHGNRPYAEGITTHTFDLSRMVRDARYKLIYNCTPHVRYSPVDSYNEKMWLEMTDENLWGRLDPALSRHYFGPRSVFELYDTQSDPAELNNLAGKPDLTAVQRRLTEALQEKMILDWDYLPLPLNE